MKTIFKESIYSILSLFYNSRNKPYHLRDIARNVNLNESTVSARLTELEKEDILKSEKDGNLKKFKVKIKAIPKIFPLFDDEKLEHLPLLRKNAIKEYLNTSKTKPLLMIIFGSTAKGNYKDDSDIDILEVFSQKTNTKEAKSHAQALTGIKIQTFQITEENFYKELKIKEDRVIQSALNTGFPVFNNKYFYELIYYE
ncbi:nucleotidyltransferase domain-containing protein [Candidatus Woesearchaeota archaeon]|nr:nucleotidyltransferase domain-containing protein [Candidatus Woesearchaeota archaeon]